MTDTQPLAPTDAEIIALLRPLYASDEAASMGAADDLRTARAVLAKWGAQPLRYDQSPTLFTVFAKCDEYEGEVPLAQYSATSEYGVLDRVMGDARNAGYTGYAKDRMTALGWRIVPVYATPRPVVRWPLTDEQIEDLLICGNPTDEEKRLIRTGWDAAHGIKGGQHGTE